MITRREAERLVRRLVDERTAEGACLRLNPAEERAVRLLLGDEAASPRAEEDLALEAALREAARNLRRAEGLSADGAPLCIDGLSQLASDVGISAPRLLTYFVRVLYAIEDPSMLGQRRAG